MDMLEDIKDVFDYYENGKEVYFSSFRDIQYGEIHKNSNKEYIRVPYIPRDENGNVDIEKLKKMYVLTSSKVDALSEKIREIDSRAKIRFSYHNISKNLEIDEDNKTKIKEDIKSTSSDKLAIATSDELNLSNCKYKNLIELFKARKNSEEKIIYYEKEGKEVQTLHELYNSSVRLAKILLSKGISKGDKVIFQIPYKKPFIESFWACMIIGAIPALLTSFDDYEAENSNTDKLYNIWNLLDCPYILTTCDLKDKVDKLKGKERFKNVRIISISNNECSLSNSEIEFYNWDKDETALILFTSGSTGMPKGVQLSQGNMLARTLGEIQLYNLDKNNVDLNWMTLTHAAGIIWSHIRNVYMNILQVQVNTELILNDPILWLKLMSEYKVSITWAPNFAFALVADNIDENTNYSLDLSKLKYIYAGGEANISRVLLKFLRVLEKYSLQGTSIIPTFGMTETSSCITYYNRFSKMNHSNEDQFIPVGEPMPGCTIRIVNDNGEIVKEGEVGHLECKGPSFTKGYYKNDKANKDSFTKDGYLITGDLGYVIDNQLTLTGREKDIIIINGLNYYVQDLEAATDDVEGVLTSYSVATSVASKYGTEEVLIFFTPEDETLLNEEKINELKEVTENIRKRVQEKCLINPSHILPFKLSNEARTDIGKKQRNTYKNDYLEGKYRIWEERLENVTDTNFLTTKWIRSNNILKEKNLTIKYLFINNEKEKYFLDNYKDIDKNDIINNLDNVNNNDVIVDFTFFELEDIDSTKENLQIYYKSLSEHMNLVSKINKNIKIYFVTHNALHLENITESLKWNFKGSDLLSVVKTLSQENQNIEAVQVDFDNYSNKLMLNEINSISKDEVVVYVNNKRYVQRFISQENKNNNVMINKNDTLLVPGGLGGIGFNLCKTLLKKYNCKLIICGRSDLENKLDKYNELKNISENVKYIKVDITNYNALEKAICNILNKSNWHINGILNLAGSLSTTNGKIYNDNLMTHKLENEVYENYYVAGYTKLIGTINLWKVKEAIDAKYMIVIGSVTAYFGSAAFGSYSASNTMQEQYCNYLRNNNCNVKSILWSFWNQTGMANGIKVNDYKQNIFQHIDEDEGISCFNKSLVCNYDISIIGINRESLNIKPLVYDNYETDITVLLSDLSYKNDIEKICNKFLDIAKYIKYKKDSSIEIKNDSNLMALWSKVEKVWKEVLKVNEIEVDDNIFDLGGDSISIYTISNRLSEVLNISIKPIDIMTNPRISDLAKHILNKNNSHDNENILKNRSNKRNDLRRKMRLRKEGKV